MSVRHNGKPPGKFWYAKQRVQAFFASFKNTGTKDKAKGAAKSTGMTLATVGAGGAALFLLPFSFITVPVAAVGAYFYGRRAVNNTKAVNGSAFVARYIREKEYKWLDRKKEAEEKKKRGGFFKRLFGGGKKTADTPQLPPATDAPRGLLPQSGGLTDDFSQQSQQSEEQKKAAAERRRNFDRRNKGKPRF